MSAHVMKNRSCQNLQNFSLQRASIIIVLLAHEMPKITLERLPLEVYVAVHSIDREMEVRMKEGGLAWVLVNCNIR